MKKEKSKSKSHETNIGKIIYGFLLFMPLIAISSTILISTFNMATKQEAEAVYKYETNDVNSVDDLVSGNYYRFDTYLFNQSYDESLIIPYDDDFVKFTDIYLPDDTNGISYPYFTNLEEQSYDNASPYYSYGYEIYRYESYYLKIGFFDTYVEYIGDNLKFYTDSYVPRYIYSCVSFNNLTQFASNSWTCFSRCPDEYIPIKRVETHNLNAQDIFYDSINKIEESNLFNWAKNSIIYTTLATTCTALSINNTFIPLLLAYWLIISVIYILYDIALVMLMIFHRKVHELQNCI